MEIERTDAAKPPRQMYANSGAEHRVCDDIYRKVNLTGIRTCSKFKSIVVEC